MSPYKRYAISVPSNQRAKLMGAIEASFKAVENLAYKSTSKSAVFDRFGRRFDFHLMMELGARKNVGREPLNWSARNRSLRCRSHDMTPGAFEIG